MDALRALALRTEGGFAALWGWPRARLKAALLWPDSLLERVDRFRSRWGKAPRVSVPTDVLVPGDRIWPDALGALPRPPVALFWRGQDSLWTALADSAAVAIVGTRRPSSHALRVATRLGEALAEAGWPVVSGLAEGVDAAAHQGCLAASGRPIAVVGTPLTRVYPPEHAQLQAHVASSGLLITEQAPEARVSRASFALRNRLLVALARVVVVVECPQGSGALLSARCAQQLGRALWVVPGDVLRDSAKGSNALLAEGASPLVCIDHFLDFLGAGCLARPEQSSFSKLSPPVAAGAQDSALLRLLEQGAGLETLGQELSRSTADLAEQLFQLELQGVVCAEPGMRWRLA